MPIPLPIVLGHQGAGTVTETGTGVTSVAVGDHVAVMAMGQCGECPSCTRSRPHLCESGRKAVSTGLLPDGSSRFRDGAGGQVRQFMAAGTFAEEIVVRASSVMRIPAEMPFGPAALLGCAAVTGFGAALNTSSIENGDRVVVVGCGVVGLFAVQGARLAGAGEIVAIDTSPTKLEIARSLGATQVLDASRDDPVAAVRELSEGRGADVVIEAVGLQKTVDQAIRMTAHGGEAVFVGAGTADTMVSVRQYSGLIATARSLTGCFLGSADIRRDVPRIVDLYLAGDLEIDRLVSQRLPLARVNEGLAIVGTADDVTAVIDFPL
jgi:alcohol dehydrogenase/S-(hydroxymethyl)glutathione dehydrogenase/alcohol dehydrogenase